MVADRFSMTDDITCFSCNELVNLRDDYEYVYDYYYEAIQRFSLQVPK